MFCCVVSWSCIHHPVSSFLMCPPCCIVVVVEEQRFYSGNRNWLSTSGRSAKGKEERDLMKQNTN
jgi:hypothetical protein